jgi:hypothetical protein
MINKLFVIMIVFSVLILIFQEGYSYQDEKFDIKNHISSMPYKSMETSVEISSNIQKSDKENKTVKDNTNEVFGDSIIMRLGVITVLGVCIMFLGLLLKSGNE